MWLYMTFEVDNYFLTNSKYQKTIIKYQKTILKSHQPQKTVNLNGKWEKIELLKSQMSLLIGIFNRKGKIIDTLKLNGPSKSYEK